MRRWLILCALLAVLSGCAADMYAPSRFLFHLECDPHKVAGNQCVSLTKGP